MKVNKNISQSMALKLDMSKAYDRVKWSFLRKMLEMKSFNTSCVRWIMKYVETITYQILINGSPSKRIEPTRGLRQNDPISPMFFLICMKDFSSNLRLCLVAN